MGLEHGKVVGLGTAGGVGLWVRLGYGVRATDLSRESGYLAMAGRRARTTAGRMGGDWIGPARGLPIRPSSAPRASSPCPSSLSRIGHHVPQAL